MGTGTCVGGVAMTAVWPMIERPVASAEESAADEVGRWQHVMLYLQGTFGAQGQAQFPAHRPVTAEPTDAEGTGFSLGPGPPRFWPRTGH